MEPRISTERDATEDTLRDAAHDAFMTFWRAAKTEQAALWAAYCAAQARYDAYLMWRTSAPSRSQERRLGVAGT